MVKLKGIMSLVVAGVISVGISTTAFAKTDGYLIKNNNKNVVYEFSKDELTSAFLNYKVKGSDPLYTEYGKMLRDAKTLYAFHDSTGKYIDYNEIKDAFLKAKSQGKSFDVNEFTERVGKPMYSMPKIVTKVSAPNGSITYQEKETGSSGTQSEDLEVISIE